LGGLMVNVWASNPHVSFWKSSAAIKSIRIRKRSCDEKTRRNLGVLQTLSSPVVLNLFCAIPPFNSSPFPISPFMWTMKKIAFNAQFT
jgi:hypothetical protein